MSGMLPPWIPCKQRHPCEGRRCSQAQSFAYVEPPRGSLGITARRRSSGRDLPRSCFRLCVALSEGGFSSVGHLDPLRVGRGLGVVVVVPVPPLVRRSLGVTLRRVLPTLLPAE